MKKIWFDEAWNDYVLWQQKDKKTLNKINNLIKDIEGGNFDGLGKPEPLRHELQGYWSRRIDSVNRIVYKVEDNILYIISCKGHYE